MILKDKLNSLVNDIEKANMTERENIQLNLEN
jgi:hypothetical protein